MQLLPPQRRGHESQGHPGSLPPYLLHMHFLGQVSGLKLRCRTSFLTPLLRAASLQQKLMNASVTVARKAE